MAKPTMTMLIDIIKAKKMAGWDALPTFLSRTQTQLIAQTKLDSAAAAFKVRGHESR